MEHFQLSGWSRGWGRWVSLCSLVWGLSVFAEEDGVHPDANPLFREASRVLIRHCADCHLGEKRKGGLSLNTREDLMAGGDSGDVVELGNPSGSLLIELVKESDPDKRMPSKGSALSSEEVAILERWVAAELPWENKIRLGAARDRYDLKIQRAELPEARPELGDHPIDRWIGAYFSREGLEVPDRVSDAAFLRRASLDLIGLLPTTEQMEAFLADSHPDKRSRWVDRLLDDSENYAIHWMGFWGDLLRNAYRGTGFIDGGREQITGWLFGALYRNMPYDEMTRELVNPTDPGARGFVKGIVWRGVVNASQVPPMQAAQNVGQVFLGTNLKCASCHDSFINQWKLKDAYGMASIFSKEPLEINRCDKPTGETSDVHFIYPELGSIPGDIPTEERRAILARLLTSRENGRYARTIVNRLWASFMGHGLIEPLDDLDQASWHPELLDWISGWFQDQNYDLKALMRLIVTSQSYQMKAHEVDQAGFQNDPNSVYRFQGPWLRKLSAEQFVDAMAQITGEWIPRTPDLVSRDGRGQGGQIGEIQKHLAESNPLVLPEVLPGSWIWTHPKAAQGTYGEKRYFRRTWRFDPSEGAAIRAVVTADNSFTLFVNGKKASQGKDWNQPVVVDLKSYLIPGDNVIAVEAVNQGDPRERGDEAKLNPAGLFFCAIEIAGDQVKQFWVSDENWTVFSKPWQGWNEKAEGEGPEGGYPLGCRASVLGDANLGVWNLNGALKMALKTPLDAFPSVRASLAMNNEFMRALGRPSRDQVVTRRESLSTLLQTLELVNGEVLDGMQARGSEAWLQKNKHLSREEMVSSLFWSALNRAPTCGESEAGLEVLGQPVEPGGVQDLMWMLSVLPEFQFINFAP